MNQTRRQVLTSAVATGALAVAGRSACARAPESYEPHDIIDAGNSFFGTIARSLASIVEEATRRFGRPNAYVLGNEASGAFIGGLRYGKGTMYTRNAGDLRVYWQGPSVGFDAGGDGDRTMMLVYNLPYVDYIFTRYAGLDGSAYFVGGLGMTALVTDKVVLVPIRSGLGARLGFNIGYLKFTPRPTLNPF